MESKVSRIHQWLRDLRFPSLRSWSNIDVRSVSPEDHSEALQLSPERPEDFVSSWNTNQPLTKKWKSSQNLSIDTQHSLHDHYRSRCSQEEIYHDSGSDESTDSNLTPSPADSTQSLQEIYHLQHYFTRALKFEQNHSVSPLFRRKLSISDPDFQFYDLNNDQKDICQRPQRTPGLEIRNVIHSQSNKSKIIHQTLTNASTIENIEGRTKHKKSLRFHQCPVPSTKDPGVLYISSRRRIPQLPQRVNDHYTQYTPHPMMRTSYRQIDPHLRQNYIGTIDLNYRCTTSHHANSVTDTCFHYSQSYKKRHLQSIIPEISVMSKENIYCRKTIRMSTLKYISYSSNWKKAPFGTKRH